MTKDEDLFASFAEQLGDIEDPEVEDFSKMTDMELIKAFHDVDQQLAEIDELHFLRTRKGRDLRSRRDAIRIVMLSREQK